MDAVVAHQGDRSGMQQAVAQILSADGDVAGAGFLIGSDVVVTCAHVVCAGGGGPGEKVRLVFPHTDGALQADGEVLAEPWRAPDSDDVAVIRLQDTPAPVRPLPVGSSASCRGHRVRSFGFPAQAPPGGHFGYGTVGDLLSATTDGGGGLLQLTGANDLTQGFSGGPIVDEVTGLVIGMVSAITAPDGHLRGQGIAYATPTETLRECWPALTEREVCPYRGLEPFTAEHAAFFHGRQAAVDAVLSALAAQRHLLLLGPSGSGKSSLIQAGVLPALAHGQLPGSDEWLPVFLPRPGQDLLVELDRHGLADAATDGIAAAIRRRLDAEPAFERIVLVIDQFEEVFTRPNPSASPLPPQTNQPPSGQPLSALEQVTALFDTRAAVSVILIMRDDFYPQLAAQAPALLDTAALGLVNVPATLSQQDLYAIITRPAHQAGAGFEKGLPERIIADVLAADHHGTHTRRTPVTLLAPLELTLSRLWERRADGRLTHTAYERIGQISGSLANWCNTAINHLPEDHHPTARRILTALVRPADEAHHIPATRQQIPLDTLRELAADTSRTSAIKTHEITNTVLATLTGHRIITTHARNPGPPPTDLVAELIHDTLTRDWPDLRDWVDQDHRFHTWLRRAEDQRARWSEHNHDDDLLHGSDLAEGLDWARQRRLPRSTAEFVAASRRNQQAAIRRTRSLNTVLVGALVVALIAAGLAFWQRQVVLTAQQQTLSRQLAARSDALIATNPDRASLLAIQAYRTSLTAEATASLYAAAELPLKRRLIGSHDAVYSLAFSPDGRTLATATYTPLVHLWDTTTGRTRTTVTAHNGTVRSVAFSPDGGTLATSSTNGTVRLRNATTGHTRTTLTGHKSPVTSVAFSPDGRTLAAGSNDGTVRLGNTTTGRTRITLTGHKSRVFSVAFSPDGPTLATASRDGTVRLWDPATGRARTTLTGHDGTVYAVAFSPDGRTLATASRDGTVRLWDPATGRARTTLTGHDEAVTSVAFSPDGRTLATASRDGTVRLWDPATGHARGTLTGHKNSVVSVAFSPDGRTLATGGDDNTVRLWDTRIDRTRATLTGHKKEVFSVAFSPDGHALATGSRDGTVRLWDPATGRVRGTLTGHKNGEFSVAFSPDGHTLATGSRDGTVRLWDPATGRARVTLTGHHARPVTVTLSPDGRTLATASRDGTVRLWDPATGRARATLTGHDGTVYAVAFSPDGRTLTTTSFDDKVRLWDPATGRSRATLTGHKKDVFSVAFSPDGRTLATSSTNGTVRLWDAATGRARVTLTGHDDRPVTVTFSPDGRTLTTTGFDDTVRLWDATTGRARVTLTGHDEAVTSLAFSPDGHALATGSRDGTVRLWDPITGYTRITLTGHKDEVTSLAFSPDGHALATGSRNGTVRLWDVELPDPAAAIRKICKAVGRDFTAKERATYLMGQSSSPVCPSSEASSDSRDQWSYSGPPTVPRPSSMAVG